MPDAPSHSSHVALRRLGCAGASAAIAAALTNPIEIIRVRFQLEPKATRPASVFVFSKTLVRDEGVVRGLMQPGLLAWMASMGFAFSFRMVLYAREQRLNLHRAHAPRLDPCSYPQLYLCASSPATGAAA